MRNARREMHARGRRISGRTRSARPPKRPVRNGRSVNLWNDEPLFAIDAGLPGVRGESRPGERTKARADYACQPEWLREGRVVAGRRFSSRASRWAIAAVCVELSVIDRLALAMNLLSGRGAARAGRARPRPTRRSSPGLCSIAGAWDDDVTGIELGHNAARWAAYDALQA